MQPQQYQTYGSNPWAQGPGPQQQPVHHQQQQPHFFVPQQVRTAGFCSAGKLARCRLRAAPPAYPLFAACCRAWVAALTAGPPMGAAPTVAAAQHMAAAAAHMAAAVEQRMVQAAAVEQRMVQAAAVERRMVQAAAVERLMALVAAAAAWAASTPV